MTARARAALADLKIAIAALKETRDRNHWRIIFITCVTLADTVAEVLSKVDRNGADPYWRKAHDELLAHIRAEPKPNIYEFIRTHRNQVLHQYKLIAALQPIVNVEIIGEVVEMTDGAMTIKVSKLGDIEKALKPTIIEGPFENHDPVELLEQVADWWSQSLDILDHAATELRKPHDTQIAPG